jgi:hypothetical protein
MSVSAGAKGISENRGQMVALTSLILHSPINRDIYRGNILTPCR